MKKILCYLALFSCTTAFAKPTIVLDAGHEPSKEGAIAICGVPEYKYNDAVVAQLAKVLDKDYNVILTRGPGQEVDTNLELKQFIPKEEQPLWEKKKILLARAAIANRAKADLFISIHHDSVQDADLIPDAKICDGKGGTRVSDAFNKIHQVGFNVFMNENAPPDLKKKTLLFAQQIGKSILQMKRPMANYHLAEFEPCPECHAIDAQSGVYYKDLSVLRNNKAPAVLIEVGNILDLKDEKIINDGEFRKDFAQAIKKAVDNYLSGDAK